MEAFNVTVKNPETNKDNVIQIVEFTPSEGRGKDNPKLRPSDWEQWTLQKAIDTWGAAKVWDVVASSKLMQLFTNYTNDALTKIEVINGKEVEKVEEDIGVIQKSFSDRFSALSRRGESLQALSRRLNEIVGEMMKLADLVLFGAKDATGKDIPTNPADVIKMKAQIVAYKTEKAQLEEDIQEIKAKRKGKNDEGDGEESNTEEQKKAA